MKTLTEINREEQARRDRAEEYEHLVNRQARLRTDVKKLSAQRPDLTALRKIYELAGEVPADLITRGTLFGAGGSSVRTLLIGVSAAALQDAERKAAEVDSALAKAKTELTRVEAALAQFK